MSYLKDREIWLSNVPTGNPPAGYFWKFIQNGKVVVRDSSGNNQMMIATSGSQSITGSLTVTEGITGTVSTASYVEYSGVANKPTLVSGSSQITYSGLTGIPSGIVSGSSQVTFLGLSSVPSGIVSGSGQVDQFGYATTGSNGFNGSQSITGSLTVTGQVIAQTLNVQQVTSSIVYSSGSNIFGNTVGNVQSFTGSLQVSGSSHYVGGYANFYSNNNTAGNVNGIRIEQAGTGDSAISFLLSGVSEWLVGIDNSDSDTFKINNNTGGSDFNNIGLSITTGGNLGIGTNSVSGTYEKLAVAGGISIKDNTNAKLEIGRYNTSGAQNSYIKLGANSNSLRFTNNTDIADIMTLTNSGNLSVIGTVSMNSPFAFRNKIHNGDMRIDQRYNGGTISNSEGTRPVDRYIIFNQIASNWSTQRSTVAPPGFSNSLLATSTTGGSIGAGSYGGIRHQIEGLNTIDLAWGTASAKNITVSFWVRSSVTGTYGFTIRNGNTNNYGYVSAYTISSANTWTYITLNIPGPTAGTWATNELPSLNCIWDLGAGTSYSQAAGSWTSASEILGLTGGVKFFTNSSATYYLTGVQLEIGDVATPFEFLPYDVQLRQVQRYFQKWGNGVMFQAGQLGQVGGAYDFFKMIGGGVFGGGEMRDTPTISYDPAGTYWVGVGTAGTGTIGDAGTIPSSQYASPQSLHILKTGIGRLGIGDFNTFSPTPVRGRWYVPNSDFVWVSADI